MCLPAKEVRYETRPSRVRIPLSLPIYGALTELDTLGFRNKVLADYVQTKVEVNLNKAAAI